MRRSAQCRPRAGKDGGYPVRDEQLSEAARRRALRRQRSVAGARASAYGLAVGCSSAAAGRPRNEDRCLSSLYAQWPGGEVGLVAVADGMGGMAEGDRASTVAIEALAGAFDKRPSDDCSQVLTSALEDARRQVQALNGANGHYMGTTCTAVAVDAQSIHVAHIGDCRAYLLRNGALRRLTADHSAYEAEMRQRSDGDGPPSPDLRSVLLRAIGPFDSADPDVSTLRWEPGDTVVVCSDGVWQSVAEDAIAATLGSVPLQAACDLLVQAAVAAGTDDNASVAIIQIAPRSAVVTAGTTRRPPPARRPSQPWRLGLAASALVVALVGGVIAHNSRAPGAWYGGGGQVAPPSAASSGVATAPEPVGSESATAQVPREPRAPRLAETPRLPQAPTRVAERKPEQRRALGARPGRAGGEQVRRTQAVAVGRSGRPARRRLASAGPAPKTKPRRSTGLSAQYVPSWELANEQPGAVAAAGNEEASPGDEGREPDSRRDAVGGDEPPAAGATTKSEDDRDDDTKTPSTGPAAAGEGAANPTPSEPRPPDLNPRSEGGF